MTRQSTMASAFAYVTQFGIKRFLQELAYRAVNSAHERRLGVGTGGMVRLGELGIHNKEFVEYAPLGYSAMYDVLRRVPLAPESTTFLDYGSGKGRAVVVAATRPFAKVIGVEISESLNDIAKRNVANMRHRKAKSVELVPCDATAFEVPADVNVVYVFNSFTGETLERVVHNIVASFLIHPRLIYIAYVNKIHFERLKSARALDWIERIDDTHFYPNYSCGIYELSPARYAQWRDAGSEIAARA